MARARNIKPGFFHNDLLVEQPFCNRLLFVGLWTIADKAGRLEDRPKKIKMCVFPADDVDIESGLSSLAQAGFLIRYEVSGVKYIQIVNWDKHQSPHHTERVSEIPEFKPINNGEESVKEQKDLRGNPPDSLIPDSLIPDSKALSDSQANTDPAPPSSEPKGPNLKAQARELLAFLNEKAKKAFRPGDANLDPIVARLKEGYTLQDLKTVTVRKCRQWGTDEKMVEYLRPATLYNRTNFAQYIGECVE